MLCQKPIGSLLSVLALLAALHFETAAAAPKATAARPSVSESAAARQLEIGQLYEKSGRFAEAETAYAKALGEGSIETQRAAKIALERVIWLREVLGPREQLLLAKVYEREDRFVEAEAAYAKVLESGPFEMREEAAGRLKALIERRNGPYANHVAPLMAGFVKSLIGLIALTGLIVLVRWPLQAWGHRKHRNSLAISGFVGGTHPEVGFVGALLAMRERMESHFRPRGAISTRAMPVLLNSQASDIVELASTVSAPAASLLKWMFGLVKQPAYRITGSIETTRREVNVRATLAHMGMTIGHWNRIIPMASWFAAEQDLAYEILITVKEHADARPA